METIIYSRELEPGKTGWGDLHQRDSTTKNEARRQAGTPTTREDNIDKAIDGRHGIGNPPQAQAYAIRHLVSPYSVSAVVAAIIAAEFGWGGA